MSAKKRPGWHAFRDERRRLRQLRALSTDGIREVSYYTWLRREDLLQAVYLGLETVGAPRKVAASLTEDVDDAVVVDLHGLPQHWFGTPQEFFYRLNELGEGAGELAFIDAFDTVVPRARHSGRQRAERPEDSHETSVQELARREREARGDG